VRVRNACKLRESNVTGASSAVGIKPVNRAMENPEQDALLPAIALILLGFVIPSRPTLCPRVPSHYSLAGHTGGRCTSAFRLRPSSELGDVRLAGSHARNLPRCRWFLGQDNERKRSSGPFSLCPNKTGHPTSPRASHHAGSGEHLYSAHAVVSLIYSPDANRLHDAKESMPILWNWGV